MGRSTAPAKGKPLLGGVVWVTPRGHFPGVPTANEAVRSFQIAVAFKRQRARCPLGNVLCQGLGEERSRRF